MAAAKGRYNALIQALAGASALEQVLLARERSVFLAGEHDEAVTCPACERQAQTVGSLTIDWTIVGDEEWEYGGIQTYYPGYLTCPVCELELQSSDEIVAAGLDQSWELDDLADPADHYEPDEDMWRDR